MEGLAAPAPTLMDTLCQVQFTFTDAIRKAQGDALGMLGFGPAECGYDVISSGPYWRLRKYRSADGYGSADGQPSVLIVPAPIKRPYIWDLSPPVSAVRKCLDHHLRLYLLEWIPPAADGQPAGLNEYAGVAISACVAKLTSEAEGAKPFIIGHSLGGTLAAIFCALEQQGAKGLVLLGAPVCFSPGSSSFRDALISLFPNGLPEMEIFPGSLLSQVSALASPDTFIWARMRDAAASGIDLPAFDLRSRVERWALDEMPLPGQFVAEVFELLYRENRFCKGTLSIHDRMLGPSCVQIPALAIVNTADEVAPLSSVRPFLDAMPIRETRIIEYSGEAGVGVQHLAMLAGPQAHARIWPQIFSWLDAHHRP